MTNWTQSEKAYVEIRAKLLTFEIRPEDRIKEEEWAQKLGLGRLGVREALARLHGEGLVGKGAKGGFFAAKITPGDVHEIHELREILEVAAIRLSKGRLTPALIQELEGACNDFSYLIKRGYNTGASEADLRFHHVLVKCAGNAKLLRAYDLSHLPLFHFRLGRTADVLEDYDKTELEHREIVAALKKGDTEKAVEKLRVQLSRGKAEMLGPRK